MRSVSFIFLIRHLGYIFIRFKIKSTLLLNHIRVAARKSIIQLQVLLISDYATFITLNIVHFYSSFAYCFYCDACLHF